MPNVVTNAARHGSIAVLDSSVLMCRNLTMPNSQHKENTNLKNGQQNTASTQNMFTLTTAHLRLKISLQTAATTNTDCSIVVVPPLLYEARKSEPHNLLEQQKHRISTNDNFYYPTLFYIPISPINTPSICLLTPSSNIHPDYLPPLFISIITALFAGHSKIILVVTP